MRQIVLIIFALLVLMFIVVAVVDPQPSEELLAYLEPAERLPSEDNLANAHYGFNAEDPARMAEVGYEAISAINQLLESTPLSEADEATEQALALLPPENEAIGALNRQLCSMRVAGCIASLAAEREGLRGLVQAHGPLIERYRSLFTYSKYQFELAPDIRAPLPRFAELGAAHGAYQAAVLSDYLEGNFETALDATDKEIAYLRRQLSQTDMLISRMVATAHLADALKLRAAISSTPEQARSSADIPRLGDQELDYARALEGEMAMQLRLAAQLHDNPNWALGSDMSGAAQMLLRPLYKVGHSMELIHDCFQEEIKVARQWPAQTRDEDACRLSKWDYVRNPVGSILFSVSGPDFQRYVARGRDVDGLIALVNARRSLLAANTNADEIASAIDSLPAETGEVFSGVRLQWEAARAALGFTSNERDNRDMSSLRWDLFTQSDEDPQSAP